MADGFDYSALLDSLKNGVGAGAGQSAPDGPPPAQSALQPPPQAPQSPDPIGDGLKTLGITPTQAVAAVAPTVLSMAGQGSAPTSAPTPDAPAGTQGLHPLVASALSGGQGNDTLLGRSSTPMPTPQAHHASIGDMLSSLVGKHGPSNPGTGSGLYPDGYNDHSTSDKWMALLSGFVPELRPLAAQITGKHAQQNQLMLQRAQDASLMSSPIFAPAAAAAQASAQALAPPPAAPGPKLPALPGAATPQSYDASPAGAMAFFSPKYGPVVAASIAGSLEGESGWNPNATNPAGGGQGAHFLAQWRGPRLAAYKQFAQQTGQDPTDPATQYAYIDHELQTTEAPALRAMQGVDDPSVGARVFNAAFERPGNVPKRYLDRISAAGAQAMNAVPAAPPPPDDNGPDVQAVAANDAPSAQAAPAAAAVPPSPAQSAALHATPDEINTLKFLLAHPETHDEGVKFAVKLMQSYASPEYEAAVNQNSGQVIHFSKNPDVPGSVETIPGVMPAAPSGMMWDPSNPGHVVPIPGTLEGPPQQVNGAVGVFQRDTHGHYQHIGDQPFGAAAPGPAPTGRGAPPPSAGLPAGAQRFPGVAGVWMQAPTGEWKRIADDGQTADQPNGPNSNKTGVDFLKTLDPQRASQVQALAEGRLQVPGGFATAKPYWQGLLKDAMQYDTAFDQANYASRVAARRDFTSGPSAKNITSMNTALGHLAKLDASIDKLGNYSGLSSVLNGPVNFVYDKSGDPRFADFVTYKKAVADELTRVFRGTGGSEKDIQAQLDSLNRDRSPEQLHETVRAMAGLLESRLNAVADGYNRATQLSEDPISFLSPEAARTLQRFTATGPAPASPQAQRRTGLLPPPRPGAVQQGYRFKGGDPADKNNWVRAQ